jgi:hypothetical protein
LSAKKQNKDKPLGISVSGKNVNAAGYKRLVLYINEDENHPENLIKLVED